MICVTMEPPTLSEIQPPTGRTAAPTKGPIHAYARTLGAFGLLSECCITPLTSGTWLTPKITFIDSGSAIEKPMKEPKVTIYSAVIDQVCVLRKISNCLLTPSFIG